MSRSIVSRIVFSSTSLEPFVLIYETANTCRYNYSLCTEKLLLAVSLIAEYYADTQKVQGNIEEIALETQAYKAITGKYLTRHSAWKSASRQLRAIITSAVFIYFPSSLEVCILREKCDISPLVSCLYMISSGRVKRLKWNKYWRVRYCKFKFLSNFHFVSAIFMQKSERKKLHAKSTWTFFLFP